jgi:hypothetical protein
VVRGESTARVSRPRRCLTILIESHGSRGHRHKGLVSRFDQSAVLLPKKRFIRKTWLRQESVLALLLVRAHWNSQLATATDCDDDSSSDEQLLRGFAVWPVPGIYMQSFSVTNEGDWLVAIRYKCMCRYCVCSFVVARSGLVNSYVAVNRRMDVRKPLAILLFCIRVLVHPGAERADREHGRRPKSQPLIIVQTDLVPRGKDASHRISS